MWNLDHKEGWALTNWCFQTVLLEKMLENPLDSKKIKPVNPKGNKPWIFIGRTDAEAEAPILWPHDAKIRLIGKYPDAGKDWGQEKRTTEDEIVGWHHWLDGREFEQTLGDSEGQGILKCCSSWGLKESGMTEQLNNNNRPSRQKENNPEGESEIIRSLSLVSKGNTIASRSTGHIMFAWSPEGGAARVLGA